MPASLKDKDGTFIWSRQSAKAAQHWAQLKSSFNTTARRSPEKLLKWLDGSSLRDDRGKPLLFSHSTYGEGRQPFFRNFLPFSHFGSRRAARKANRWEKFARQQWKHPRKDHSLNFVFYQVALRLENPLPVNDDFGSHGTPDVWNDYFRHVRPLVLSKEDRNFIFKDSGTVSDAAARKEMSNDPIFPARLRNAENLWKQRMILALEKKGYDGIIYRNFCEDRQSLSFINFRTDQARIVGALPPAARRKFTPYVSQKGNLHALSRLNSKIGYGVD